MSYMASLTHGMPGLPQMASSALQTASMNYMSRVPSLPENLYGTSQICSQNARPGEADGHHTTMAASGDKLKATSSLGQHYYVDHMMNPHPYSTLYPGFDINAIRRKNATRETTGPLKVWLSQHRKNPYPTKGEKVMLAIATRMTLTQVSTWFANARRRMKKDNLSEDEEQDDCKENVDASRARSGSLSSRVSQSSSEADLSKDSDISKDLDISDVTEASPTVIATRPSKKCIQRLFSPDSRTDHVIDPSSSPESLSDRFMAGSGAGHMQLPSVADAFACRRQSVVKPQPINPLNSLNVNSSISDKPKIWSISEIIGSASNTIVSGNSSDDLLLDQTTGFPNVPPLFPFTGYNTDYLNYQQYHSAPLCSNQTTSGNMASQQSQNSEPDMVHYL